MNFLQLAQEARTKCGISGTGPTTVVGQTGELGRVVGYVRDAWQQIQSLHQDWQFLRKSVSFTTTTLQATYTPLQCGALDSNNAVDLGMWVKRSFRNYNTAAGFNSEVFMDYAEYDNWRNEYQFGALRSVTTRPLQITITPDKSLGLGPVPIAGYTIVGDYFAKPFVMSLDTDTPTMPDKFHMMIVYSAMMMYGAYEGASEVYQFGETKYNQLLSELVIDQLPDVDFGSALA